jgi:uncharacterized protein YndB with AHSA1/START domain
MPEFEDATVVGAPVEEVWKLLYDPTRLPEWMDGIERVDPHGHEGRGDYTMYPAGYPDFPMPQALRSDRSGRTVTVSCLVSALVFEWRLEPLDPGDRTRVDVHVEIPESEAHRLDGQREVVATSLRSLAALAEAAATGPPGRG